MIFIFGDSFSTSQSSQSWTQMLGIAQQHSQNGVSEYRILQQIRNGINDIRPEDIVIVCHTNPFRIFVPDSVQLPARQNSTHPKCDMVISDIMNRGFIWKFIANIYYKYFFDEKYNLEMYRLIRDEITTILNKKTVHIVEISGFEGITNSIYDIYINYPGIINHMSPEGNKLVANRIKELI